MDTIKGFTNKLLSEFIPFCKADKPMHAENTGDIIFSLSIPYDNAAVISKNYQCTQNIGFHCAIVWNCVQGDKIMINSAYTVAP